MIYFFIFLLKKLLIGVYYCLLFAWSLFSFKGFGIIFVVWWYISMRFACIFVVCLRNMMIFGKSILIFSLIWWAINSLRFRLLLFIFNSILIMMIFLWRWLPILQCFITILHRITLYFFYLFFPFNIYFLIITSTPLFLNLFMQTILFHIIGAINCTFIFTSILSWWNCL